MWHLESNDPLLYYKIPDFSGGDYKIGPLFLFQTTQSHRDQIIHTLSAGDSNQEWPAELPKVEFKAIRWWRNKPADTDIVFDLLDENSRPLQISVDEEGARNGTCIVSHRLGRYAVDSDWEIEVFRVPMKMALFLASFSRTQKEHTTWVPDLVTEEMRMVRSADSSSEMEWEIVQKPDHWKWPAHLPLGMKLEESKPTLISLFHLTDDEIDRIKTEVCSADTAGSAVDIINWPADIQPASQSDLWHIFDRVRPDWPLPCGEVFGFFIESHELEGENRCPELFMFKRQRIDPRDADAPEKGKVSFVEQPNISGHAILRTSFLPAWRNAFNYQNDGSNSGGVTTNGAMRFQIPNDSSSEMDILNPDNPVITFRDIPVFFLLPVNPVHERLLRLYFQPLYGDSMQVTTVPNGDGTIRSLMQWFQSPEFMRHHKSPPSNFFAADSTTIAELAHTKNPSFLLATALFLNGDIAWENVGYRVVRGVEIDGVDPELMGLHGIVSRCCGFGIYLEQIAESVPDQVGAGDFYFDCFDEDDQELASKLHVWE